jgi:methyl-accepting chemotaxis protein
VENQAINVADTNGAIQQMAVRLQRIAGNTKDLTGFVDAARTVVKEGMHSVSRASQGMREISKSITTTATTIYDLGEHASAIGRVIELINSFAQQTNLLALNASIEAARAGVQGLGFGVVAGEVRKLSERTAQSVEEISQLVTGVQIGVAQAAKQMGISTNLMDEGLIQSTKAEAALGEIESVVSKVANNAAYFGEVIAEQSASTSLVLKTTQELNIVTQEIQAASQEQAISTGEINKAIDRVREASDRNAKLAGALSQTSRTVLSQSERLEKMIGTFVLQEKHRPALQTEMAGA